MFFSRKKKDAAASEVGLSEDVLANEDLIEETVGSAGHEDVEIGPDENGDMEVHTENGEDSEDNPAEPEEEQDEWAKFDLSQDWRADGPFDIDEVDLSADEVTRLDLGALILTPERGMNIKLVANADTKEILHVVVENGPQSALQLTVFAAPSTGNYCARVRKEIIAGTQNAKVIEQVKGPFGTELRRVLTVSDDKGNEGFAPVRDWLLSGPRWVLNARLVGQAALDTEAKGPAAQLEEFVHNIIVRRGDAAMVPGAVIPLQPNVPTPGIPA